MSKMYVDGQYLEVTDELKNKLGIANENIEDSGQVTDTAKALAEGLASATTLAQVRAAAKVAFGEI